MTQTWESLKESIRELYLVQNESREHVMSEMKRLHNFTATETQYERQLKKWNFRKNLTFKEWAVVVRRVEKRKREGLDSDVFLNGQLVPVAKLQKKASTCGYQTTWDKERAKNRVPDDYGPMPEGISIRTPSACRSLAAMRSTGHFSKPSTCSRPENPRTEYALSLVDISLDYLSGFWSVESIKRYTGILLQEPLFMDDFEIVTDVIPYSKLEQLKRHVLEAPYSLLFKWCIDKLASALLQQSLLLNDFNIAGFLIHSDRDSLDRSFFYEVHDSRFWVAVAPIELAIHIRNVAATKLLLSHGAQTEQIGLERIGMDVVPLEYDSVDAFDRDRCVQVAEEILQHLCQSGLERFSPKLLFSIFTIVGNAKGLASILPSVPEKVDSQGHKALVIAARLGHMDVARVLLDAGVSADQVLECHKTVICPPLFWATRNGHLDMVNLLLQNGAWTERPHCSMASMCKTSYHENYEASISEFPTVLQLALAQKDNQIADTLLLHGADSWASPVRSCGGLFNHLHGRKASDIARENNDGKCWGTELQRLVGLDRKSLSSLRVSIAFPDPKSPREMNKDPEKIRLRLNHAEHASLSFLHAAAWNWDLPRLQFALRMGANINWTDGKGLTVLHCLFLNYRQLIPGIYSFERFQKIWNFMMDHGAKVVGPRNAAPLILAVASTINDMEPQAGIELFVFLIDQGLTCNDVCALIFDRSDWFLNLFLEAGKDDPHFEHVALLTAVRSADREAVGRLLRLKFNKIQPCIAEALTEAKQWGFESIAQLLLDYGVDPGKSSSGLDRGFSPETRLVEASPVASSIPPASAFKEFSPLAPFMEPRPIPSPKVINPLQLHSYSIYSP